MTASEITELLFVRDPPGRSDLAIVFGHHEQEIFAQRARHGASLLLDGYTTRLLLTGGPTADDRRSEAEVMAAVARDRGVPAGAMLLETRSRTTVQNLALSVSLLARANLLDSLEALHLVSCPWHMRRVSHLAREAFGPTIRLLASPHDESCTAFTWATSPECHPRVLAEVRLVRALLGD